VKSKEVKWIARAGGKNKELGAGGKCESSRGNRAPEIKSLKKKKFFLGRVSWGKGLGYGAAKGRKLHTQGKEHVGVGETYRGKIAEKGMLQTT